MNKVILFQLILNLSITSLWNFYRDEQSNPLSTNSESFNYKTSITGNTYNVDEKITDDDGNEVDNPNFDVSKVGKNETVMNAVNTEFSYVEVWFTDQSSKALEIEDNVNLTLIIG